MLHSESHLLPRENISQFIFGGKALFTVLDTTSGLRFTFKITESKDKRLFFVSGFTGTDNNSHYSYLGIVRKDTRSFERTSKSKVSQDAPIFVNFDIFFSAIKFRTLAPTTQVWHEGRCGCCGKRLTVPDSISSGFGPFCIGKKLPKRS